VIVDYYTPVGVPSLLTIHIIHTGVSEKVASYRQSNKIQ
jgi:hypothetical protein